MAKCPNCNYTLALLEHRRKYKCAKCGKLFSQKDIDTKEFVEYNKQRRAEEKKKIRDEIRKAYEEKHKEKLKKNRKDWEKTNKEKRRAYLRKYYATHREEICDKRRKQHSENKDMINQRRRSKSGKEKIIENKKRNARRHANIEATRLNSRIWYWRQQQKALALTFVEFGHFKPSGGNLRSEFPTMVLS